MLTVVGHPLGLYLCKMLVKPPIQLVLVLRSWRHQVTAPFCIVENRLCTYGSVDLGSARVHALLALRIFLQKTQVAHPSTFCLFTHSSVVSGVPASTPLAAYISSEKLLVKSPTQPPASCAPKVVACTYASSMYCW